MISPTCSSSIGTETSQPAAPTCDDAPAGLDAMFVDLILQSRISAGQCPVLRPVFQKLHGVAACRLQMRGDADPEYRAGLFAADGYDGWIRFSSDTAETATGFRSTVGVGLKLWDIAGGTVLDGPEGRTADFIFQNHPVFFVDDAQEMCRFIRAGVVEGDYNLYLDTHPVTAEILDAMAKPLGSVLASHYWTILPAAHGERYAKLRLSPAVDLPPPDQAPDDRDYLARDLADRLAVASARFVLSVQLQSDPDAMPLDRATVRWSEDDSPFVPIADLTIGRQTLAPDGDSDRLAFNIFRVPQANAPLGSLAEARRRVYRHSATVRREASALPDQEPQEAP